MAAVTVTERIPSERPGTISVGPDRKCKKCLGEGSYYSPPIEQQLAEIRSSARTHKTRFQCGCRETSFTLGD